VRIRLIIKDPRNIPDCYKSSLRLTRHQLLESGEKGSPCLKAWRISQSINYRIVKLVRIPSLFFQNPFTNLRFSPSQQKNNIHKRSKELFRFASRKPREGHAVGCHGAGAPVAKEHRRLPSSDCVHWHTQPDGALSRASKIMFLRSSPGLPSILFATLGCACQKPVTETGMFSIPLEFRLCVCYLRTATMGDGL